LENIPAIVVRALECRGMAAVAVRELSGKIILETWHATQAVGVGDNVRSGQRKTGGAVIKRRSGEG